MSLCQYLGVDEEQIEPFPISRTNIVRMISDNPCPTSIDMVPTNVGGDELVDADLVSITSKIGFGDNA